MDYIVVCIVALFVSGLTFIAGFGLGTMLMPAFAIFFPLPLAIAATAIVHLANNIFKVSLIGLKADLGIVLKFGIPGFLFSILGAYILHKLEMAEPIHTYGIGGRGFDITYIKILVGCLIIWFALMDLVPLLQKITFSRKHVYLGGALSGFFGGLSGHQGALRTSFLIKFGLKKETFIATGIVVAVLVDFGRLAVYGKSFYESKFLGVDESLLGLIIAATLSAFGGAVIGRFLLKKVTFFIIQILIGILLVLMGIALCAGIV